MSAITYNNKIKEISEKLDKNDERLRMSKKETARAKLHFDEFQEKEETSDLRDDKHKISLVYPDAILRDMLS